MYDKEELTAMEEWQNRVNQDISELKQGHSQLFSEKRKIEQDVQELKVSDKLQDKEISGLKDTLHRIQDDTQWIRRRITGALITAIITAIVGGVIGIAVSQIYGG